MSKFIDFLRWRTWPTAVAEIMANQTVVTKTPVKRRKLSQDALRRRNHSLASRAERRRLEHMTHVLPPPQGHRRPEFCGDDDIFWTTPVAMADSDRLQGDITSGLVQPKRSLWTSFR